MANATTLVKLSGSTKGRGIKVAATATLGTTIHVTSNDATKFDRIRLYAYNNHTIDVALTIEFGGVTVPDDIVTVTIPLKAGRVLVIDDEPLFDAGAGVLTVSAFASVANVVTITGHVKRITP